VTCVSSASSSGHEVGCRSSRRKRSRTSGTSAGTWRTPAWCSPCRTSGRTAAFWAEWEDTCRWRSRLYLLASVDSPYFLFKRQNTGVCQEYHDTIQDICLYGCTGLDNIQYNGLCLCHNLCASLLYFVVRVGCRRKTVHVRYLISWWASCINLVDSNVTQYRAQWKSTQSESESTTDHIRLKLDSRVTKRRKFFCVDDTVNKRGAARAYNYLYIHSPGGTYKF